MQPVRLAVCKSVDLMSGAFICDALHLDSVYWTPSLETAKFEGQALLSFSRSADFLVTPYKPFIQI